MQFTTLQVRTALNIPSQTLRYWRKILEPLKNKPGGKSARFSVGEILALAVIEKLVNGVRIEIGAIAPIGPVVFELCRRPALLGDTTLLCIDVEAGEAKLIPATMHALPNQSLVLLPIASMSQKIKTLLIEPDETEFSQGEFPWPLTAVK